MKIEDGYVVYNCGCKFKILEYNPPMRIDFDINYDNIRYDCPATWELIGTGNTKGLFQLETRFGQQMAKKLKPENLEHLSGLAAVLRPGCLEAKIDGKSITEHYIDRKNKLEESTPFHPALDPILHDTYNMLIYQEQVLQICEHIAGFSLIDADLARRSIAKKQADLMVKVKKQFIDGCKQKGIVNEYEAEEIFGWIEKGQRYLFNKSHSYAYAVNGYLSAYAKTHFKRSFFTSYLYYAKEKPDKFTEMKLLANNAKAMNIDIKPPSLTQLNAHFQRNNNDIICGLMDIKDFGESSYKQLISIIKEKEGKLSKKIDQFTWPEFLIHIGQNVKVTAIKGLIECGALDHLKLDRLKMLFEFEQCCELSPKELKFVTDNIKDTFYNTLEFALQHDKFCMKNRRGKLEQILASLKKPPYSTRDTPDWIARVEEARMGLALTCSVVDACKDAESANASCQEVKDGKCRSSGIFLAVQLKEVKETVTKNGKNPGQAMAFISMSDHSGEAEAVIFPNEWAQISKSNICFKENLVLVAGELGRNNGFVVKNMWQMA